MSPQKILLTLAAAASVVLADSVLAQAKFAGKREMNGITYDAYKDFETKWKFITVRFRKDSGEQRFVWANHKAIKALEAGSTDYPDGSVFAKIGFATEADPLFTSSMVPSGSKRYQFMVRDKKKYADTGGWGYALFDGNKMTYESDPKVTAQSCYVCHKLAEPRGQVFSVPLKIASLAVKPVELTPAETPAIEAVTFATVSSDSLPEIVQRNLPKAKKIRSIQGELRKHVFRGTIDEIRPTLIEEAIRSGMPAALIEEGGNQFHFVYVDDSVQRCASGRGLKSVFSTNVAQGAGTPYLVVAWQDVCH